MWVNAFLISIFCWSYAFSKNCMTPIGEKGTCVLLKKCKELDYLASELSRKPQNIFNNKYIINFLKLSQCGLEQNKPKVCCGSVPKNRTEPPTKIPTGKTMNLMTNEYSPEDSLLAPRDKCGRESGFSNRIFGGEKTELNELPWMALLGYRHNNGFLTFKCGGSLLNRRYVLTAAHCIGIPVFKLELVRLGEYDVSSDEDCQGKICADPVQDILIDFSYIHPDYTGKNKIQYHDVAILRLASRATYSDYVQPICIGSFSKGLINNEMVASGWGETSEGGSSNVKQKIKLGFFNKGDCVHKYHNYYKTSKLAEEHICVGGKFGQDMCQGDSGGPLMIYRAGFWEQVAVTSFGRGCGMDGWPGIFTNITGYQDWIKNTLQSSNK